MARFVTVLLLAVPALLGAARAPFPSRASFPTPILIALEPDHPVYAGDTLTISASLTDPDPSRVDYQFLFDGSVIQPWSSMAFCRRMLTLGDIGLHRIEVQVRGPHGEAHEDVSLYVYRRPPAPAGEDHETGR